MAIIVDIRPNGEIKNRHKKKKEKLIFHLTCTPNQKIYLGLTQNQEGHLMRMILNRLKKKIQEVAYQECVKMKDQENLVIKEGKIQ
jgi:hypothetical protein